MKDNYDIIRPRNHDGWLSERSNGVGASECAKLIGCSNYGSAFDLFCDKLGLNTPKDENWAMRQGHIFEREVAYQFQMQTGLEVIGLNSPGYVKDDWIAVSKQKPYLRVSPDYIYWTGGKHNRTNRGVLECKTSVKHFQPDCLKNECLSWYCQVQYQLYVLGLKEGYLGFLCIDSLTGGESWFEKIDYNQKFCEETLIPAIVKFWTERIIPARQLIKSGATEQEVMLLAPEPTTPINAARRYPREEAGKAMDASVFPDFFSRLSVYIRNRQTIKELEKFQSEFEDEIRVKMVDYESILGTDGKPVVTFKASKDTARFDSEKFKRDYADLYNKYCEVKRGSRRLVIK